MPVTDLQQVRAVTANYFFWQGLRWIPIGVALVFIAATYANGVALPPALKTWAMWPLLLVAFWLSTSVLGAYYRRTFGEVQADPAQHRRRTWVKWLAVYPAMLASMVVDIKVALPIVLSGIVWGLSIELYRRSTGGGRPHYALACVAFILLGLLPLLDVAPTGKNGVSLLIAVLGVVYIIGGILDHLALVRILGRRAPR